ncbi:tetratricopeptide repeat protein [Thermochromatium tepidum]|uniref:Tetratricopeptide repeat protein n=1 Tax=Thermochromatium tepidum ATCC 43061 TaxID=316276 RepID=A0A6I6E217_THETI|nr:tetratricopeptide repeat protein [Thermochromatium tepidum]QGU32975.1 tetratricopeptide repeat protein [Thermochromatium tepidum ATCC 43061]
MLSHRIQDALQQTIEHHQAGRLPEAERLYRAILQVQPNHPDAHHNLGQLVRQMRQPRAALPHLKAALEAKPDVAQYWLSFIAALSDAGEVQTARSVLEQARARGLTGPAIDELAAPLEAVAMTAPAPPTAPSPAAEPLPPEATQGSPREAAQTPLQPAIDLRERGDYAAAEAWLRAHLAQHGEDAAALALLAQVRMLRKDDARAAELLQRAAAIDAKHPAVLRNRARLKLKQNAPQEALALAEAAWAAEPTLESRLLRAAALAAVQRSQEAAREIDAILAVKPDYAEAWANRALVALRSQQVEAAIAAAERAVALKPHLAQIWRMLAGLRLQHRHDLSGAIAALEQALVSEPDDVATLSDLGEFLRRAKRLDEALQVLARAVSLDAGSYNAWVNYGTALQEAQRLEEAQAAYEKALAINPRSPEVANNLGAMAKDREDWEEALRYFEQALAEKPDHAEIMSNKAAALTALERFDEAEAAARDALRLQEAIRLKPKAVEYRVLPALMLPSIMDSADAIAHWRSRYQQGIAALQEEIDEIRDLSKVSHKSFYLAYHNADDRPILEALSQFFRSKAPQLNYTAPHIAQWRMSSQRRIRLGIVCRQLSQSSCRSLHFLFHQPSRSSAFRSCRDLSSPNQKRCPHQRNRRSCRPLCCYWRSVAATIR